MGTILIAKSITVQTNRFYTWVIWYFHCISICRMSPFMIKFPGFVDHRHTDHPHWAACFPRCCKKLGLPRTLTHFICHLLIIHRWSNAWDFLFCVLLIMIFSEAANKWESGKEKKRETTNHTTETCGVIKSKWHVPFPVHGCFSCKSNNVGARNTLTN